MPFTLPDFNLTANVWNPGNKPALGPADFTTPAQLYVQTKLSAADDASGGTGNFIQAFMRVPYSPGVFQLDNIFECPVGFGRYVLVMYGYIAHMGFPNEYLLLSIRQCNSSGTVVPWTFY